MAKTEAREKTNRRSNKGSQSIVRRFLVDENGNVILWVCCVMLTLLCISAFAIDLVHAMVVERQLQASADAAALAAAEDPSNYPTLGTAYQLSSSSSTNNAGAFSAGNGDKNAYTGVTLSTNTVTPLCLTTVAGWSKTTCASSSSPNAMRVTQAATIPTYFAALLGWTSFTPSVISTATVQGSTPLPYNVAILVDSTLSMSADDGSSYCTGLSQEQCALEGVQALLGSGGSGSYGLAPSVDNVALFTFPNVLASAPSGFSTSGIVSGGSWKCTSSFPSTYTDPVSGRTDSYYNGGSPSSGGYGYTSTLQAKYSGSSWSGTNMVPYSGVAWAMPYTFPAVPIGSSATYSPGGGVPTYEIVGFSNDYRTSDRATTLNSSSNLVKATGFVSGCGGLAPSNFDGNYGTYYAGALYAAQAALVAEQQVNGYPSVMIILGDGNNNGPGDTASYDNQSPSVSNSSKTAELTSTYKSSTELTYTPNTGAYTYPSGWIQGGSSNGRYPSWVATCSQAVVAATAIKTYTPRSTAVYTVAYGSPSTSSSSNCGYDRTSTANYEDITPCQTMQWMATGGSPGNSSATPSNYFYSDYTVQGGDPACQANSSNNSVTSLVQIFHSITSSLTHVRLIPNSTT
ncbi:MAG TPA: pilus assembly protein TadG-related protein [Acidobacteriaceae bacterium]